VKDGDEESVDKTRKSKPEESEKTLKRTKGRSFAEKNIPKGEN